MSIYYNQVLGHWIDASGNPATTFWTTLDQSDAVPGGLLTLMSAAQALTNAKLVAVQYQTSHIIGGAGTNATYPSINDRAVLLSSIAATGRPSRLELPAPKQTIFLTGNQVIDLTNVDVVAFQAQVMAQLGDTSGHANGPFKRGNRQRAKGG